MAMAIAVAMAMAIAMAIAMAAAMAMAVAMAAAAAGVAAAVDIVANSGSCALLSSFVSLLVLRRFLIPGLAQLLVGITDWRGGHGSRVDALDGGP